MFVRGVPLAQDALELAPRRLRRLQVAPPLKVVMLADYAMGISHEELSAD